MTTDAKAEMTDVELLHFYLGLRLQQGDRRASIKQILSDFPDYLRQRGIMRGKILEAEESIATGDSGPLDLEQAIHEVVQDLAAEGVIE